MKEFCLDDVKMILKEGVVGLDLSSIIITEEMGSTQVGNHVLVIKGQIEIPAHLSKEIKTPYNITARLQQALCHPAFRDKLQIKKTISFKKEPISDDYATIVDFTMLLYANEVRDLAKTISDSNFHNALEEALVTKYNKL